LSGYPSFLVPHNFLERAWDFFKAFRDLPAGIPPSWPRYFLLCHAAELALRAFLLSHGMSESLLRDKAFTHRLKELLAEATKRGLALSPSARGDIELLDEAHAKFWHRYPRKEAKPIFVIEQFESPVEELLRAVSTSIRSGG
jgi:HEPN domain-containing protein